MKLICSCSSLEFSLYLLFHIHFFNIPSVPINWIYKCIVAATVIGVLRMITVTLIFPSHLQIVTQRTQSLQYVFL